MTQTTRLRRPRFSVFAINDHGTGLGEDDSGWWHIIDHERTRTDNGLLANCQRAARGAHDDCVGADHDSPPDAHTGIRGVLLVVTGGDHRVLPYLNPIAEYSAAMDHDPETAMGKVDVPLQPHLGLQDRPEDKEDYGLDEARTKSQAASVAPHAHLPELQGEHGEGNVSPRRRHGSIFHEIQPDFQDRHST